MDKKIKENIRKQYDEARTEYQKLLTVPDTDLSKQSYNKGWKNKEILFHMLLGFIVIDMLLPLVKLFGLLPQSFSKGFAGLLNFSTPVFNTCNAFGTRVGGQIFSKQMLEKKFDTVQHNLLKKLDKITVKEWEQGMYYPDKWDGLFDNYMTMDKLFEYPYKHFNFHKKQIAIKEYIKSKAAF